MSDPDKMTGQQCTTTSSAGWTDAGDCCEMPVTLVDSVQRSLLGLAKSGQRKTYFIYILFIKDTH